MTSRDSNEPAATQEPPVCARRNYLIDPATQLRFGFGLLFLLICGMGGAVGLWAFSSRITPDDALAAPQDPAETGRFAWWINAAYFAFLALAMLILCIRFTHRFIGPARVISRAVSRMCEGDYGARLTLRRGDKLQDLAQDTSRLAQLLQTRNAWLTECAAALHEAAESGDVELLREHSRRLDSFLADGPAGEVPAAGHVSEYDRV